MQTANFWPLVHLGVLLTLATGCAGTYTSAEDAGLAAPDSGRDGGSGDAGQGCLFCDNFDDGPPSLASRWDSLTELAGPMDLDGNESVSPPRALRLRLAAKTGLSGESVSALRKSIDVSTANRISIDLDYRGDFSNSFTEVDPIDVVIDPPPPALARATFALALIGTSPQLQRYGNNGVDSISVNTPLVLSYTGWHHLKFKLAMENGAISATLTCDGIESKPLAFPASSWGKLVLRLGAQFTENAVASTLRFDNVVVTRTQ